MSRELTKEEQERWRNRPSAAEIAMSRLFSSGLVPHHNAHLATSLEDKGLLIWI
jgi:hypothetical protein